MARSDIFDKACFWPPGCTYARSWTDVLRSAASLARYGALQAAMLLAEPKSLPDLGAATLDEIFAV